MLKPAFGLMLSAISLTACKPSTVLRSDLPDNIEVPTTTVVLNLPGFQSGTWTDDLGNRWQIDVAGTQVRGLADAGGLQGLMISGTINGLVMAYSIEASDIGGMAIGTASLVDARHAYFASNGSISGHGLFHFDHETEAGRDCVAKGPRDLRPPEWAPVHPPEIPQGD